MMSQFQDPQSLEAKDPDSAAALEVLDSLISLELAFQEAESLGYSPSPEEADELFENMAKEYGNANDLEKALSEFGESLAEFRAQLVKNQALKNWRDTAFLEQARVTEAEARLVYDQNPEEAKHDEQIRASQILLPLPFSANADQGEIRERVRARARDILAQARAGADFDDLIERYMDKSTLKVTNHGQMGWVSRGSSFPELEEVLFKLKPGEVGDIIETPFSFYLVKAQEHRPAGTLSFSELKPEIVEFMTDRKIEEAMLRRIMELKRGAAIEILEKKLADGWPAYLAAQEKAVSEWPQGAAEAED
jgi:parvulin-like peptidyl-prolyl isomerase